MFKTLTAAAIVSVALVSSAFAGGLENTAVEPTVVPPAETPVVGSLSSSKGMLIGLLAIALVGAAMSKKSTSGTN